MLSYFGLSDVPFGKEIPTDALLLLPSVKKNLAATRLLVETRGIGVITGKAGTGRAVCYGCSHGLPPGLLPLLPGPQLRRHAGVLHPPFALFGLEPPASRPDVPRTPAAHPVACSAICTRSSFSTKPTCCTTTFSPRSDF